MAKRKFIGEVNVISAPELLENAFLTKQIFDLIAKVYDEKDVGLFYKEVSENRGVMIQYLTLNGSVIGIGCICESYISYGMYELFWDMLDKQFRGNGWGKILIDERIKYIKENMSGVSSPNDVIAVTNSPWHLTRCGFEVIKQINEKGEVLMYRKLNKF